MRVVYLGDPVPFLFVPLLFWGLGLAVLLMWLWWYLGERVKNAALGDMGWAFTVMALAGLDVGMGNGWTDRRILSFALVALWCLRLLLHLLFTRVLGKLEAEPYRQWRRKWGKDSDRGFLFHFERKAALALFFSLPFLSDALNPLPEFTVLEKGAILLWIVALTGETLADLQLQAFKRLPANRRKACRVGFWRYSRHPNYFFEFLIWCANAFFALEAPLGPLALACPIVLFFLFFKATGIPAVESRTFKNRGRDYGKYLETTSVFLPLSHRR